MPLIDGDIREALYGDRDVLCEADLFDYQKWMVRKAFRKPYVYLAADMGLGKTAVCLKAAQLWRDYLGVKKTLVIAPLEVARYTWPTEANKWSFGRMLRTSVVCGTAAQREAALAVDADIYFINRENIPWLYWHLGPRGWFFDALIYDEATRLKSGKFRTAKVKRKDGTIGGNKLSAFGMLVARRKHFKRVVELSGTPTPQGVIDLWGPIYLLDLGKRLMPTRTQFIRKWFIEDKYSYTVEPRDGAPKEILGRVQDIMFSLRTEDYRHYEKGAVIDRWVRLPRPALEKYRRLEKDAVLEEHDIEAVTRGVLANKLLQFANGAAYNDDGDWVQFHDAKLKELESIIEEANGAPILLFYSFKFDLERLRKKFKFARVFGETDHDLDDWNAGKIRLLLAHPASAGHGLNFQYGGNIIVWFGLTWNLEYYLQANKRLERPGQTKPVFIYRILARDTYDEVIAPRLGQKKTTQDRVIKATLAHIEKVEKDG